MADGYADFLERLFTPQGNSRDTAISLEDDAPSPSLAPQGRNPSLSSHPTARPDFSPLPPASERRPTATPMPRPDRRGNSIGDAISVEHYSRSRFGTSASQVQRDRNRALNKPPSKPTATDTVINLSSDDERDPSQPPAKTPARHQSHSSRADPSQPRPSASRPEPHRRTPLPEADLLNAPSSTTLSSAASSSTPKTPRGPVKDMHRATLSSRFLSNEAPRSPTSMSRREGRLTERPSRSPVTPFSSRTGTSTLTRPSRSGDSLPHGTPSPSEDTVLETAPTQTETSVSNEASKPQEMVSVNQGKSRAVPERSGLNIPAALLDHSDAQGALGLEVGESVDQAKLTEDSRARITDLKRIIERNWPKAADYDDYEDYLLTRGGLSLPEVWSMEFAETLAHVSQLDSVENFLLQAIVFLNRNKLRTPEHRPRGDQIWGELQKGHLVHIAKLIEQTPSGNRRITRPASPLAFSVRTEPATDLGTGASSQIEEDTDSNAFHQRLLERPKRDLVKILKRVEQMVNGERETTQPASPMASLVRTESAADLGTGAFAEIEEAPALLSGLSSERLAPAPKYFSENSSGREPPDLSPESPASSYLDESNIAADPQANRERLVQEGGTAANTLHTEEESLEEPESNEPIVNLRIAPRARNILPSAQTEVSNLIERSSNTRQKIDYRDTEGSRQQARASPAPTGQLEKPNEVDVEPLLKAHLTNIRETHAAYVKNLLRRQRQSLDRDLMLEKKSDNRSQSFGSTLLQESSPPFDPFAKLQAIQLPASSNIELGGESVTFTQVTRHPPRTKAIGRTNKLPKKIFKAPVTIYESDEKEVPSYREYALYRTTVLGLNSRELLQWPWGEEETSDALWEDLKAVDYNIPTREKSCLALRIEQSRSRLCSRTETTRLRKLTGIALDGRRSFKDCKLTYCLQKKFTSQLLPPPLS
ncbi:hypothetical protein K491DRAFT_81690 [Lophiostoma macrostomum CBS 122681]|uniref:Uncharacterized protein n=1 Tax=Lophiostoma macrostomum CBS 122681 TaxID=1314788 RepID=A0A6A6SW24_9PLEO|nr:hypothetical protein K491DRAFT_81690 [Lophiostoma macrostomum CBS 122681]